MKTCLLFIICFTCFYSGFSQLVVEEGASLNIGNGSAIFAGGNVSSHASIRGAGRLVLNGSALQLLNMNGDSISNLQINNAANINLSDGSLTIDSSLSFISGVLKIAENDLILSSAAVVNGAGNAGFISTDSTGMIRKKLSYDVSEFLLPLGEGNNYRPAFLTATGNTYTEGTVSIQSKSGIIPNLPPMIANHINAYWAFNQSGISGGAVSIKGQYMPADVSGVEDKLNGYYFNGIDWSSQNETHDGFLHQFSAPITGATGILSAMNKFISVGSRAFLQGAYTASNGLMNDALRTGVSVIPLTDPYRSAPYSAFFTHINNNAAETAAGSVFADQTNLKNNIVDWVFLELRNTAVSPGNTILSTRSALIQRDGDIVDVDGVSPVTFNIIPDGNYALAIRHRNHLGISLDPGAGSRFFSEKTSAAFSTNVADFRVTNTFLYGSATAYAQTTHPTLGLVRLLWAGNASMNSNTRYTGLQNDKDAILINALGNNSATVLNNVYSAADLNMNRVVRFNGLSNDKDYLYISILSSSTVTQRLQALPD